MSNCRWCGEFKQHSPNCLNVGESFATLDRDAGRNSAKGAAMRKWWAEKKERDNVRKKEAKD